MVLYGFSGHGQRRGSLDVVAKESNAAFKAGDGFLLFHRQAISPWLRWRTRGRRRSLLVFGDVAGRVCTQGVAIRPEGKSENSKADDDNGSHDRQIRVRRFGPLARWFCVVGHGVHSSGSPQAADATARCIIRSGKRCPMMGDWLDTLLFGDDIHGKHNWALGVLSHLAPSAVIALVILVMGWTWFAYYRMTSTLFTREIANPRSTIEARTRTIAHYKLGYA